MSQNLKISLITAVYNNAEGLRISLASSLRQNYKNIERIIVDGGSIDRTLDVIESYRDYIDYVISEPDDGIYDALNKGMKVANGDILGVLHSDDYFPDKECLTKVVEKFERTRSDALYADLCYVNKKKKL